MFRRQKRKPRALASAPDTERIWGLAAEPGQPSWLQAIYEAVNAAIENDQMDDALVAALARGYRLTSGRDPERIPRSTKAALDAAAAVGYRSREAETIYLNGADPVPEGESADPNADPVIIAGLAAIDPEMDSQRDLLRERTLSIVVRENGDGGLTADSGPIEDASLDDFREAWKYGFLLRYLNERGA